MTDRIRKNRINGRDVAWRHNALPAGEGAPALVLLHGAGGSSLDWPQEWLDDAGAFGHLPVFALDLPGHGASDGPGIADVATLAQKVEEFTQHLGLRDVCLVGHSMGALIALATALRAHAPVTRLILIAGAARFEVHPALFDSLKQDFDKTVHKIAGACWHDSAAETLRTGTENAMRAAGLGVLLNDFGVCDRADLMDDLADLAIPVLAIAASEDRLVRLQIMQQMCERIKGCHLEIVPDAGHFVHLEKRPEVERMIAAFLDRPGAPHLP